MILAYVNNSMQTKPHAMKNCTYIQIETRNQFLWWNELWENFKNILLIKCVGTGFIISYIQMC